MADLDVMDVMEQQLGASGPCPHCGAAPGPGRDQAAVGALLAEVARIRELAEQSADQSRVIAAQAQEIRLLRETVARLRGAARPPAPPVAPATGPSAAPATGPALANRPRPLGEREGMPVAGVPGRLRGRPAHPVRLR